MSSSGKGASDDDDDRTQIARPTGTTGQTTGQPTGQTTGQPTPTPGDGPVASTGRDDEDQDDATRVTSTSAPDPVPQDPPQTDERTRFMSQPPATGGTGTYQPTIVADPAPTSGRGHVGKLAIGTLINNNYRIDAVLKSGGMGEVYRGTEIHTDNPVAIKAILRERADDVEAGLMFRREASTLSRLSDDTIVRYLNFVPDAELQRYFLVMEFIEGVPLKDYVATYGALSVPKARTLLSRLAKGLAAAHEREVIHRDLSPDNVMLADGDVEQARLIDFGIAKSTMVSEATIAGRFAGKFKYVAPEQLGHYGGTITPATDIYGLGLLTAAAVIGKPLDMGSSIVEAVQSRQTIPDISLVPAELRPILSHMLEPNPADRPASMRDVKAMVDDPSRIPPKYLGDWVPPVGGAQPDLSSGPTSGYGMTQSGGTATGLQVPWRTQTGSALRQPTTAGFSGQTGPGVQTVAPKPSGSGAMGAVLALVVLAALGGGGYVAWSSGLIPSAADTAAVTDSGSDAAAEDADGIPPPLTDTREGFLAALDTPPCTYATRVAQGPNAGVVEGFATTDTGFAGLPAAYESAFGARPEILFRQVTPEQCAAVEFARALQGRGRGPNGIQMFLSADEVPSRTQVTAQITVPSTQSVWVLLISPRGLVYNLSGRVSVPVGNSRTMGFALTLGQGVDEATQLLLAVESDAPLASAALVRDRDTVATALPQVLEEIAGRGGAASVSLSYLKLIPAEAAPDDVNPSDGDAAPE